MTCFQTNLQINHIRRISRQTLLRSRFLTRTPATHPAVHDLFLPEFFPAEAPARFPCIRAASGEFRLFLLPAEFPVLHHLPEHKIVRKFQLLVIFRHRLPFPRFYPAAGDQIVLPGILPRPSPIPYALLLIIFWCLSRIFIKDVRYQLCRHRLTCDLEISAYTKSISHSFKICKYKNSIHKDKSNDSAPHSHNRAFSSFCSYGCFAVPPLFPFTHQKKNPPTITVRGFSVLHSVIPIP